LTICAPIAQDRVTVQNRALRLGPKGYQEETT
jgi:hypothetical protein